MVPAFGVDAHESSTLGRPPDVGSHTSMTPLALPDDLRYLGTVETSGSFVVVNKRETVQTGEPGHFPRCQPYLFLAVLLGTQLLRLGIGPLTSPPCHHVRVT
jgi:hypothetical protein